MNIKELLQKEVPLPINAIKKPFIWICNLKRYISFNLIAFIGWLDLCLVLFFIVNGGIGDNKGIPGIAAVYICFYYFIITRGFLLILLLLFICEKFAKFKIRKNIIIDNIIYDVLFCFSLIFQTVTIIFFLWLWITA